jgi:hypothetical protein
MLIVLCLFILLFPFSRVEAIYDPLSVANNVYGIHIADTNDISTIAPLINSSGGDWGYVTVVIPDTDKNTDKWNGIFNELRRLHIIPIVRIATHVEDDAWIKPKQDDIADWVRFLNSLNWPVENRYVALFNEPNHAKEWGDSLDPEGYAKIFVEFAHSLKSASEDYFILPAALDASASTLYESMDAAEYLKREINSSPEFLTFIDGWNSHSYPNPAFSGSPYAAGRGTLRSYLWELDIVNRSGLNRQLPVFITETGWEHREGKALEPSRLPSETISAYIQTAANFIWNDPQIVAVTPFVFSYQDVPFDHFSWKMLASDTWYPFAYEYRDIKKAKGMPKQHQSYKLDKPFLPLEFVSGSTYELTTRIKNNGQNILDAKDGYRLYVADIEHNVVFEQTNAVPYLEPNQSGKITVTLTTPEKQSSMHVVISLGRDNNRIRLEEKFIRLVPPPSLSVLLKLGFNETASAKNAKIIVYNMEEKPIHEYNNVMVNSGRVSVTGLTNIIPGRRYRVVVIVPGYLPRQSITPLNKGENILEMPVLLPFDFDNDGAFSIKDIEVILWSSPYSIWRRIIE